MKRIFSFLFLFPFCGLTQLYTPGAGVTDIDGNLYQTIIINNQEWMAENLRTTQYSDGTPIPLVSDSAQWTANLDNLTSLPMMCWLNNDQVSNTANIFGAFYNWYSLNPLTNGNRDVCPTGWHVPSVDEWFNFIFFLDSTAGESPVVGSMNYPNNAGGKMKSTGTEYWENPNQDATNESGFSGLPGGYRAGIGFYDPGFGLWWSSTEKEAHDAWYVTLSPFEGSVQIGFNYPKEGGFSVRCLNNNTSSINELMPNIKVPIKIVDVMGNETSIETNKLLFFLYNDGSVEKKIIIEQ